MVQLIGRDGLNEEGASELVGHLGRAFGKALFIAAAAPAERLKAARALEHFYNAARKLHARPQNTSTKNAFNTSAQYGPGRGTPERLRLLSRLPLKEQFPAMREYSAAKAAILSISREIGTRIVHQVARQGINRYTSPRSAVSQSAPSL